MDSAAEVLSSLPKDYHHVFDLVHFILAIQGERQDMGDGWVLLRAELLWSCGDYRFETTSRQHPLASWVSAMMACFAGETHNPKHLTIIPGVCMDRKQKMTLAVREKCFSRNVPTESSPHLSGSFHKSPLSCPHNTQQTASCEVPLTGLSSLDWPCNLCQICWDTRHYCLPSNVQTLSEIDWLLPHDADLTALIMIPKNFIELTSSGGLLVNPLCGEPLLAALGDGLKVLMATVLW